MKMMALVSALIALSWMNVNAEACPSSHTSRRCAVSHHPVKHANKKRSAQSMRGAFIGAYQR
jgi:hypothetical protein